MEWGKLKKDLMGKAQDVADKMNKLVQHGLELAGDESQMHGEAKKLYHNAVNLFKISKGKLKPEVEAALDCFIVELHATLDRDGDSPYSKYPEYQCKFADQCIDLIKQYKSELEADPELWNQLKAHIHVFLDKITLIVDTLAEDFATDQYKLRFTEFKKVLA
jgi:hypothetical protein